MPCTNELAALRVEAKTTAEAIIAKAHQDAESLRTQVTGEVQRDVDALTRRREEIKAEMGRVQGVLNALAGPVLKPVAAASDMEVLNLDDFFSKRAAKQEPDAQVKREARHRRT